MRLLKKKIALSLEKKAKVELGLMPSQNTFSCDSHSVRINQAINEERKGGLYRTPESSRAVKNVAKNYGRAICSFASSDLAKPYLTNLAMKEGVGLDDFVNYVKNMKEKIDGLFRFRSLLLKESGNSDHKAYKKMFQMISEIFIKYFSVNWIFHSKIQYRQTHLNFRFKMLRRIQNPELFTYLQNKKIQLSKEAMKDK